VNAGDIGASCCATWLEQRRARRTASPEKDRQDVRFQDGALGQSYVGIDSSNARQTPTPWAITKLTIV